MDFGFINIFYLNNASIGVDNVKTINGTFSLGIVAEDFSTYGQEVFVSVSVTPENTKISKPKHFLKFYQVLLLLSNFITTLLLLLLLLSRSVDCELLLYADGTCLIFQHKDITEIESTLNKNFSMLCD